MNDQKSNTDDISESGAPQRRVRPLLVIGGVLWLFCLVGILYGWYEWHEQHLALEEQENQKQAAEEAAQKPKQITLVPRRDGGFVAKDGEDDHSEDPWDSEGIEDFSFKDCYGQMLTKNDLLGKPFIISFVFTNCRGPCPTVTRQMRETQDRLKDYDFNLVSVTVDPARDSAETLLTYGKDQGADFGRWKFLTGDQTEIYGLIHRSFKMPVQELTGIDRKPGWEILHSTNIMLVNAQGRVVGKFNATVDPDMAKLRREIKRIAKRKTDEPSDEKAEEKTGENK